MRYEVDTLYTDEKRVCALGIVLNDEAAKLATELLQNPFTFGGRKVNLVFVKGQSCPLTIRIEGDATFEEYQAATHFVVDAIQAEYKRLDPLVRDMERILALGLLSLPKSQEGNSCR